MKVVIHQPHFLPWLGYFNKLSSCDLIVFQDDVQFRRRYYQNRTKIRNTQGLSSWLTVPVSAKRNTIIKDVKIADSHWKEKILKRLHHTYKSSIYFDDIFPLISTTISKKHDFLIDLNILLMEVVCNLLGVKVRIDLSSSFSVVASPTEKLVAICDKIGADEYVFGEGGGIIYHGTSMFKKHGIKTYQQEFLSFYEPINEPYFEHCRNLSVLDYLFNLGIDKCQNIIEKDCLVRR
ncbi:MAG: WbqC family protein [Flavobacteriaceae bacterium]|nr:WbqC family protein [Flavobacteriaceae bacterium]